LRSEGHAITANQGRRDVPAAVTTRGAPAGAAAFSGRIGSLVSVGLLTLTVTVPVRAAEPGPWIGGDKALHVAVSAGIAGAGYGLTTAFARDRWKAFAIGGGAALAAGALKEGYDAAGHGDPSWKDFGWDVLGAAVGLAIAWGVDVGVHGGDAPPLSSRLSVDPRAPAALLVMRF
jgi:putative lipoprotein